MESLARYLLKRGLSLVIQAAVVITLTFVVEHLFSEKTLVAFGAAMLVGISLQLGALHENMELVGKEAE